MLIQPDHARPRALFLYISSVAILLSTSLFLGTATDHQLLAATSPISTLSSRHAPGLQAVSAQGGDSNVSQQGCSTKDCHSEYQKPLKYPHAPVKLGMCTQCHGIAKNSTPYKKGTSHRFTMTLRDGKLCLKCHESETDQKHVHTPLTKNKCVACHAPHGSDHPALMRKKRIADTCYACHDEKFGRHDKVHAPVAVGQCTACHDPHASPNRNQLVKKGSDLCFSCHSEMEEEIKAMSVIHKPVLENCVKCHTPHGAKSLLLLKRPVEDLCLGCHEEIKEAVKSAKVRHGALDSKKSCLQCHDPHASNQARLLLAAPKKVCLSCHDKKLMTKDRVIRNMKEFLADNRYKHGPIREGDCGACHNAHGSPSMNILRKDYPKKFYAPFKRDTYSLCFTCHEESLVEEAQTATLTGFRNGIKNLHFVHVNREKKGRTCRACHDVHASNQPKHIVDTVPFGKNWSYELKFELTPSGGKCGPACHVERSYSRIDTKNLLENQR